MKILIIGPAGSGKYSLANQIAKKYALNHVELDSFKHGKNWEPIDKEKMRQLVRKQIIKSGWVIDGNYISTFGTELVDAADIVIWLDYSFPLVFQRLLRRTLKRTITREELWNGNRESFYNNIFTKNSVLRHLMYVWKRQRNFYLSVFNHPKKYDKKRMIRVRRPKELTSALRF